MEGGTEEKRTKAAFEKNMAPARRRRSPQTREEIVSRALSKTLRHKANEQGIPMTDDGFCQIADLMASTNFKSLKLTREDVLKAVSTNSKKRFELSEDGSSVRAVQGHSLQVNVSSLTTLTPETIPSQLIHGTYLDVLPVIRREGLKRMGRLHIHMATGQFGEVISGMRKSSQVLIYLDGPKMLEAGIELLQASNGAVLSPGMDGTIAPEFFSKIVDNTTKRLL